MDLFFIMWMTTTILGLVTETLLIVDICKSTTEAGYKINKKEIKKLFLPASILFIPIFNLPFITREQFKYMYFPLWHNLSEIKSENIIIPLTNEELKDYNNNKTHLNALKIIMK